MRRKAVMVSGFLFVLCMCLLVGCGKKKPQPEELLLSYMELLNEGRYEEMYTYLTPKTQENIEKEAYVERYEKIYGGIEAREIQIELHEDAYGKKNRKADTRSVEYTLSMNTIAGKLSFDTVAIFQKDEEGNYRMNWDSQDIFPNLRNTDKVRVLTLPAKRGNIYDRNQVELAREGIASSVGIVPGKLPEQREEALEKLSELLDMSTERIEKALSAGWVREDTFVPLRTVSKEAYHLKEKLLTIPGIMITDITVRFYPFGEKTAQLTGYVQNITAEELEERKGQGYNRNSIIGKAGVEKLYEEELRPKDGYTIQILDGNGEVKETVLEKTPEDGKDVILSVHITLQQYLYQELAGDKGCAVAMNPKTGELLALVSTPAYDPNDFVMGYTPTAWEAIQSDVAEPLYNRYLATWVPGSAFKPVVAAIGLTEGTIDPERNVKNDGLQWQKDESWGNYYVTTLQDYSVKNLENALIYSDNIYFAKAAVDLGTDKLEKNFVNMGFGEQLPSALPAKASSFGTEGKLTSETELADSGYGQGKLLVNPIHLSLLYSAFVNDGNLVRPQLIKGEKPELWKEGVFSPEAAEIVLEDLYKIVENPKGTAHEAKREYPLAGKTGTAEVKVSKEDTDGTELGWFVGMRTEETEKPLLIVMMVEDVKGRGGSHYVLPKVMAGFDGYYRE